MLKMSVNISKFQYQDYNLDGHYLIFIFILP